MLVLGYLFFGRRKCATLTILTVRVSNLTFSGMFWEKMGRRLNGAIDVWLSQMYRTG